MKRSFRIIIVLILSANLITAFRNAAEIHGNVYPDLPEGDTINLQSFIRTDSTDIKIIPPSRGVRFYRDGIIYLASSKLSNRMIPLHESFGNINTCYSVITDTIPGKPVIFMQNALFPYPSDGITFNAEYNLMYYSKPENHDGKYKIFKATISQGQEGPDAVWTSDATPLSFCSDSSIYTHPALSGDGKIMVFSSDRPGTQGGMDLFVTTRTADDWSAPVDIPGNINSVSNEGYPFLDKEGNLYFSSDRKSGYGGYDVYFSSFNGQTWDDPVNLGRPVNSALNDIAFVVDSKEGKTAFYSKQQNLVTGIQLINLRLTNTKKTALYSDLGNLFSSLLKTGTGPEFITLKEKQTPEQPVVNKEPVKKLQDTAKKAKTPAIAASKTTVKTTSKPPVKTAPATAEKTVSKPAVKADTASIKPVTATKQVKKAETPVVVYRVQILSNTRPKGSVKIKIAGVDYNSYEYLYKGAYRTCVGEFKSLKSAAEFQSLCRKNGYSQAFVAAFRNDARSNDPELFRR